MKSTSSNISERGPKTGEEKTALALSAGGLFCAYQAGAYQAMAETKPPDLIAGASGGALNAWAIAGGCTPERLIEQWLSPVTGETLQMLENPGWRGIRFDPEALGRTADRLVAEFTPRLPIAIVVTRLPRLETVVVRDGAITAAYLRASCAIPYFLPPVRIDGDLYIDGGLLNKLPYRAAAEMGATRIIAVDALPRVGPWWFKAGMRAAGIVKPRRKTEPRVDAVVIAPSEPLGEVGDAVCWKRDNVARWIDLGYRDATRALAERF